MSSITESILDKCHLAIENGWTLRPCGSNGNFININHQKKIKLSDESHILGSIDELERFPSGVKSLALVAMHLKGINFVSLDCDFTNPDLKKKFFDIIYQIYRPEDLFWRIGNPDKLGQFWFQTESLLKHNSAEKFDLIVHEKRCNAIGEYKDTGSEYIWRYKNPWDNTPDELPFISAEMVESILELFKGKTKKASSGSRHDALKEMIFNKVNRPGFLNLVQDVISSPDYISLEKERDAKQEMGRLFSWAVEQTIENYNDISGFFESDEKDLMTEFAVDSSPEVDKNSIMDIFYRAIRRNQYTDNKKIAFFTALSMASWLLTFSTRFHGLAPNLMILFIAHSGAGKSTTSKAIREIIKICKQLQPSFMGNDIRTEAALFSGLENAPNPLYVIDEFTKLFKAQKSGNSHTSNITEIMCQLYSDYRDDDLHSVKLKSNSYGVCLGPKLNMISFSTPEIWKVLDESTFSQGIGRRVMAINDDTISFARKNVDYNPDFFTKSEKVLIQEFIENFVFPTMHTYVPENIKSYELTKGVDKKGEPIPWEEATSFNVIFDLKATKEVNEYFKDKFIDKINALKKIALRSGNELSLFVINSMPEFTKKLAMIHTMAGKPMIEKNDKGNLEMKFRTHVEMDSVEWAEKMYLYYMVNGLNYDLESIYKKDIKEDQVISLGDELMQRLKIKDVKEFMISHEPAKTFFRGKGKIKADILQSLVLRDKIEVMSRKASKRGAKYRVLDEY